MELATLVAAILILSAVGFYAGRDRALSAVGGVTRRLHSLPSHYGFYVALWAGLPVFVLLLLWLALEPFIVKQIVISMLSPEHQALPAHQLDLMLNDVRNIAAGVTSAQDVPPDVAAAAARYDSLHGTAFVAMAASALALACAGIVFGWRRVSPHQRARNQVEKTIRWLLIISSTVAVFTTIGIILSLLFEALRFFQAVPFFDFLFGITWSPQTAIRADQVGASGAFGAVPVFAGTLMISAVAMFVAVPIGLFSAIYLSQYAVARVRTSVKPILEILAGIPTVVYGFFAALTVAPLFRDTGATFGISISSESAVAAGVVMGVMIIPFVSSISDDVISAVPKSLSDGSYAMGATQSETIRRVILPAALPGIVAGILLAVSRAIGETMIVVMAAGLAANLTANPFESMTTVTVQIVTLLVGDQEFDSPKTLAAFALGLVLFAVTLLLNIIALAVVRKYREEYE